MVSRTTRASPSEDDAPQREVQGGDVASCDARLPPALPNRIQLLNPCATPLNKNNQHDDKEHTGYDPDDRRLVHVDSPFVLMVEKRF
jgi:hypothetical protein